MTDKREKMIERIRALRAKAADSAATEAEAQAAAEAAAKLLLKFDLDEDDLAEEDRDAIVTVEFALHDIYPIIGAAIGRLTETKPILKTVETEAGRTKSLTFTGERVDVEMAVYLSEMIRGVAQRGWLQAAMELPKRGRNRATDLDAFKRGYWQGLGDRLAYRISELAEARRDARQTHGSLPVLATKESRIRAYVADAFGKLSAQAPSRLGGRADGYEAGRRDADRVGLGRPVGGSSGPAMIGAA